MICGAQNVYGHQCGLPAHGPEIAHECHDSDDDGMCFRRWEETDEIPQ